MEPTVFFKFPNPNPSIRRELVDLLYTSFPQVLAINVTAASGAIVLAMISGDTGYGVISSLILITATAKFISLGLYRTWSENFSDADVLRWERIYGLGASAFGIALGFLSFRALELGDAPGARSLSGFPCPSLSEWFRARPFAYGSSFRHRPFCLHQRLSLAF
jgi:hypothetical protein